MPDVRSDDQVILRAAYATLNKLRGRPSWRQLTLTFWELIFRLLIESRDGDGDRGAKCSRCDGASRRRTKRFAADETFDGGRPSAVYAVDVLTRFRS
jgi:hypothetical protein